MELESSRNKNRIRLLKIPIDVLDENDLEGEIVELLNNGKNNQIVILNFLDFIKGRHRKSFRSLLENAALVLPSSSLLIKGIYFLFKKRASPYVNYDFVLKILNILEKYEKSVYIIGSDSKSIRISEKNLKDSYPGLHLVGRSSSQYQKARENDIILAIKKSSPSLLLAGSGLRRGDRWLYRNKGKFNPGITLWSPDCFEIFSGRKKRPSKKAATKLFSKIISVIFKPWRIVYVFPLIMYYLTLLIYKIFKLP